MTLKMKKQLFLALVSLSMIAVTLMQFGPAFANGLGHGGGG